MGFRAASSPSACSACFTRNLLPDGAVAAAAAAQRCGGDRQRCIRTIPPARESAESRPRGTNPQRRIKLTHGANAAIRLLPEVSVNARERPFDSLLQVEKVKTDAYLSELQKLAKSTGKDYTEVLKDVMSLLGHSIADLSPVQGQGEEKVNVSLSMPPVSSVASPVLLPPGPDPREAIRQSRAHLLSMPDLNPPEVQRLVVEHIVKNDDSMLHTSTQRLRVFSGRFPRPQNESDYETFRSAVDLMLKDPSVSDLQRSRRIIESLLPPAADMVKHLRADTAPTVYIQILDSAYGAVQDGDELHAKFMDTFQDAGEKPSSYLQRLQVVLSAAVKRGGVSPSEIDRQLLNQFCRGCWDNTLISELQLKSRKSNPPSFADLLLLLRTEEDREAAKTQRMKQHLGACKVKAVSHVHYAGAGGEEKPQTTLEQLAKQLAEMQKQLNALQLRSLLLSHPFQPMPHLVVAMVNVRVVASLKQTRLLYLSQAIVTGVAKTGI
ncbi:hypothetical protein WMY93_027619 [Mugilogobius chulae]|uniref:Paraneoplastic antigen Ma-like C-terminal domain-containing protein n=1 Tax=Mugilogobius chulae TaxID=88201 RepID=A0AAW0MUI0_9GOBI